MQSGTQGDMGELENLLANISKAINDLDSKKLEATTARTEQETKKLAACKELILALLRG